jgi:hypothetical protein
MHLIVETRSNTIWASIKYHVGWYLIDKAHLRCWCKFWEFSQMKYIKFCKVILIVFIFECQAWITMAVIKQKNSLHLNTRLVRYSDGWFVSLSQMVQYSMVFKWHLNTYQTNWLVFKWSISLAYVLWSENRIDFRMVKNKMADFTIWKPDTNCVQKITVWVPDCPVFRWWL